MKKFNNVNKKDVKTTGTDDTYKAKITRNRSDILQLLNNGVGIKEIAKIKGKSQVAVYRLISRMIKSGLLNKDRTLTQEAFNIVKKSIVVSRDVKSIPNTVRLHDLQFKVKILRKPENWESQKETILKLKNIDFKSWPLKNHKIQEFYVENIRIRVTNKSVLVLIDNVYSGSPQGAKNKAMEMLYNALPKIESLFKISLEKPRVLNINITRQHNALIFNEIAKQFLDSGIELRILDNNGNVRLIVDDSHKLHELEAISVVHSEGDAESVKNFLRDLIFNPHYTISDLSKKIDNIVSSVEILTSLTSKIAREQQEGARLLNQAIKLQNNTANILNTVLKPSEQNVPKMNKGLPPRYMG